jgi:hypothetical protein
MKVSSTLRSRARVIAWALLPALLLRAFTPAGFMPMHDAQGGLYLAFCPGIGDTMLPPAATDDPHRGHQGMHGHGMHDHGMHDHGAATGKTGDTPAPEHHNLCPYALSAGPALAYSVPDVAAPVPRVSAAIAPDHPTVSLPSIDRAQSARAPPAPRIA